MAAAEVERVRWDQAKATAGDLALTTRPLVVTGALASWPASRWTPRTLAAEFGETRVRARFHSAGAAECDEIEGEGIELEVALGAFAAWLVRDEGWEALAAELAQLPPDCTGYVSYHRFVETFSEGEELRRAAGAVRWETLGPLGGARASGEASTLWFSGRGAHTPCHYDTYGANCVAQLYGTKRWTLLPPSAARALEPTRVPYEESSVFSRALGGRAGAQRELGLVPGALRVDLEPGELLVCPKHWWHSVVTTSEIAISANLWVALADDARDRCREALARMLATALLSAGRGAEDDAGGVAAAAEPAWLNPRERAWPAAESLAALGGALAEERRREGREPDEVSAEGDLDVRDVVDALCAQPVLDAALMHLRARRAARGGHL